MTAPTITQSADIGRAAPAPAVVSKPRRRLGLERIRPRHLWWIPGLAVAILGSRTDSSLAAIGVMVAFGIAPHLAFLAGMGQPRVAGHLAPRAAVLFNAMHVPIIPAAIVALHVSTGVVPSLVFVAATAWLSHIVIGWALGDGRRPVVPVGR